MKIYTIHEPPAPSKNSVDRAISLIFIKYGFSWAAFFFSPLYFIFKSQWFGLFIYFLCLFLLSGLFIFFTLDKELSFIYLIILHVFIGFEASTIHRIWLKIRGWREIGSITGSSKDACERTYFSELFSEKHTDNYKHI